MNIYITQEGASEVFNRMHTAAWEKSIQISSFFSLKKENKFFKEISAENEFDLIYFDAFVPGFNRNCGVKKYLKICMAV